MFFSKFQKRTALITSILALSIAIGCFVFAWTEPSSLPPLTGLYLPINTGPDYQNKLGDLGIGGGTGQDVYKLSNSAGTLKFINNAGVEKLLLGQDGALIENGNLTINGDANVATQHIPGAGVIEPKDFVDGLTDPTSVFVQGDFAYIVKGWDAMFQDRFVIFDISDPENIVTKDSIASGLSGIVDIYVQGDYAYVVSGIDNKLAIFDISNPDSIVAKGSIGGLDGPACVFVHGDFAYTVSQASFMVSASLIIFDVSNPDSIVRKDSDSTNLDTPIDVFVQGNFAYVINGGTFMTNGSFAIFDISNPDSIVSKGHINTNLSRPRSVFAKGNFAYVADQGNSRLLIFDVSNPDSIVAKDYISTNLSIPKSVFVRTTYAYVASQNNSKLVIFDVLDPDNILFLDDESANLSGPVSVFVSGFYVYVASNVNGKFCIFKLVPPDESEIINGNLSIGNNLTVDGDLTVIGVKSAKIMTSKGVRRMAAVEAPTNNFITFGSSQLSNGEARINIEPLFLETISAKKDYQVFLTAKDSCSLYVADQDKEGFLVKKSKGKQDCAFDWFLYALRKGYEDWYMEP
jgi:hypothetical protein